MLIQIILYIVYCLLAVKMVLKGANKYFWIKIGIFTVALFLCMIVMLIVGMSLNIRWLYDVYVNNGVGCLVSPLVLFITYLSIKMSGVAVDKLIAFHKNNNAKNINRNPIKFFIKNENKIRNFYRFGYLLADFLMLYGLFFDAKLK